MASSNWSLSSAASAAEWKLHSSGTIVIDLGTSECKAGFAGESNERISVPTVVGKPKQKVVPGYTCSQDNHVGVDAQMRRAILDLRHPMYRGIVKNWDDMEKFFDYIFKEGLKVDASLYSVVLTEPLTNPKINREKLIELMFETYDVQNFYLSPAPPMALYAYGFQTGVAVDSGEGQTHIAPVYEGFSMLHSTQFIPLGGKDITGMLETLLTANGKDRKVYKAAGNMRKEYLRELKESQCYVAANYEEELAKATQAPKPFRLPDGNFITFENEQFLSTEAMFDPEMLELKTGGIHENLYRAIQLSDPSIKHLLYGHIVLSGGNTLFNGLRQRLANEMRQMSEPGAKIHILAKPDRKNAVFRGASMISTLSTFQQRMITFPEYVDDGPAIVHRRCF